jgi:hypothetical protein
MKFSLAQCILLSLAAVAPPTAAWTSHSFVSVSPAVRRSVSRSAPSVHKHKQPSRLYNVPPPSEESVAEFKTFASKQPPPASFFELQKECVRAIRLARKDGHQLLEVEFPPLPAAVLEMDDVSAYEVAAANLNLAIDTCKGLLQSDDINKIAIVLPDEAELDIATVSVGTDTPYPGVSLTSLRMSDPDDKRIFKPEQLILGLFGRGSGGLVKATPGADVYIILLASAQELPDVEELALLDPDKTIVFYNMYVVFVFVILSLSLSFGYSISKYGREDDVQCRKSHTCLHGNFRPFFSLLFDRKLDILRGDLGAPAFPSKDLHDRFLSLIKPTYYLRTRQYTRSTTTPPFLVNFQGCLFRTYPGHYQTLLDTGSGRYRRLVGTEVRPALGEFKEQLIDELKDQGILQDEGETLNFLRTGYVTKTWWEEPREEANDNWMM